MIIRSLGLSLALVFVCALFSKLTAQQAPKKWTTLVFLNADNNLEDAGYEDIQEMEEIGSTSDMNVVVQFDWYATEGTRRYYVEKATDPHESPTDIKSKVIEDMPEQDMGSADVFQSFVEWGMKNYPAENYFIILWNHGAGWSKSYIEKSISYDDTSGNHITTNQLSEALRKVTLNMNQRISVLGFDACLMGMFEVATSMKDSVDFMIGSEETEPGDGYPYNDFLKDFNRRKKKGPKGLVESVVSTYGKSYSFGGSQGKKSVTQSGYDLSKIETVAQALNEWIVSLEQSPTITRKGMLSNAKDATSFADAYYRDLGDYVRITMDSLTENLDAPREGPQAFASSTSAERRGVIATSSALLKAIDGMVVSNFNSARFKDATGVAIYLPYSYYNSPWSNLNNNRRQDYFKLLWATETIWTRHLDFLFEPE